jgi:hypothetical protein
MLAAIRLIVPSKGQGCHDLSPFGSLVSMLKETKSSVASYLRDMRRDREKSFWLNISCCIRTQVDAARVKLEFNSIYQHHLRVTKKDQVSSQGGGGVQVISAFDNEDLGDC